MRLLMISGDTSVGRGERGVFHHMLGEFAKHWEGIDIIVEQDGAAPFTMHGNVNVHPIGGPKFLKWKAIYRKGMELWRRDPFQLMAIHSYPPFLNEMGGWLLWKRLGVPFVLEVMHIIGHPKAADMDEMTRRQMSKLLYRYVQRNAAAVRVINHREVPDLLKKWGVPEGKIIPIPCYYIDFDLFKPMDLPKEGRRVIYCGRLSRNKGIFDLLDAFPKVLREVPEAELWVVGGGPLKDDLINYAARLGINHRVEFKGAIPHAELGKVYSQCDLLAMTSYSEGGPRVTLEAMACGIPVISSRVGIMTELIEDGVNGLLVSWDPEEIGEKIVLLLKNSDLSDRMGKEGLKTVKRFELSKMVKAYADAYKGLIRRPPERRETAASGS